MSSQDPIVIVSAARTPIGGLLGDFSSLAAHQLGAIAVKAAVERAGIPGDAVNEVLLGNPSVREVFMKHHADLLDAAFWQAHKERILAGHVHDVFPYEASKRFKHQRRLRDSHAASAAA
jgi:hypothetical protein